MSSFSLAYKFRYHQNYTLALRNTITMVVEECQYRFGRCPGHTLTPKIVPVFAIFEFSMIFRYNKYI